ncbi:MAG TPA: TetR/AcrR family transcriptional regulator [Chloroflexota bacterium]|jgi:AcrR family transcriptional regulator|nr:TetR/AcrR family transcriptional regulator [Chloroflexota bacterium]
MPTAPAPDARERILRTAAELFYREGIRAVGIDTIVARSGVAKMTLYRHFASKDDLVVAYLRERDARFWRWFERALASGATPRDQLVALFEAQAERVVQPDYRGCPFVNAAVEFPEPGHPGREVVLANKRAVRARLRELSAAAGAADPDALADQLALLLDGAYASAQALGGGPATRVAGAAAALIDAQLG